ncbi:hypothetical protein BDN71DRAFT_1455697 [Pleurotus eryngii]|uniref:Uncharacterized protein n=1 Tax=Pleurotus eryngii TaxID=5323 RepID=A0A9P5ZLF5_PLEER|nr:hypothetical protein BDN71DRAFT_1455697 [Pleurotus eryngii]
MAWCLGIWGSKPRFRAFGRLGTWMMKGKVVGRDPGDHSQFDAGDRQAGGQIIGPNVAPDVYIEFQAAQTGVSLCARGVLMARIPAFVVIGIFQYEVSIRDDPVRWPFGIALEMDIGSIP